MFRAKRVRNVVAMLLWMLVSFTSFWTITNDAADALKGVLILYLTGAAFALSLVTINDWVEKGED